MTQSFLCIITPIFDPALDPAKCLIKALQKQSFEDFCHVLISNGASPQTKQFSQELQDPRFIYDEIPFLKTSTQKDLVCDISKRREYCLKKYDSDRFLFLNADLKILDDNYFEKLFQSHLEADILLTQVLNRPRGKGGSTLPKYPITAGRIDASNFSVSRKIAKACLWPIDYHPLFGIANDYRFFKSLEGLHTSKLLPFISAEKDGNHKGGYKQISQMN
jgi:hypothetical protein